MKFVYMNARTQRKSEKDSVRCQGTNYKETKIGIEMDIVAATQTVLPGSDIPVAYVTKRYGLANFEHNS